MERAWQKTVWMYWENPPGCSKPVWLDLCLETIRRRLGSWELKLLDENTVTDFLDLPWVVLKAPILLDIKADYIRYALLHRYGGLWLDCDFILLKEIDELAAPLERADFVICANKDKQGGLGLIHTNVLGSVRGCGILGEALSMMDGALGRSWLRPKRRLKYLIKRCFPPVLTPFAAEKGPAMFRRILPKYPFHSYPARRFGPNWSKHEVYYREMDNINDWLKDDPFGFNLWNSGGMGEALKDKTREQLLGGRSLLSHLFRLALEEPAAG
ncbi:MAG: glycosyltransferase [Gammaproteobacteria bacterium]|nr:glycosyltransferase [Gammaproteobacteria bacterium]